MVSWILLAGLALVPPRVAEPSASPFCSVVALRANPEGYFYPLEDIRRFVLDAEVIVRAVATDSVRIIPHERGDWADPDGRGVVFDIREVLRGRPDSGRLTVPGTLVSRDDFNPGQVPYRIVRRAGQHGDCLAREYRVGGEYLLLLRRVDGILTPYWGALAPLNEQVRGDDDAWLAWVRAQIGR